MSKVERITQAVLPWALARRRGWRTRRGGGGGTRPSLPAERSRLQERSEGEHPETRERRGECRDDRQEIQAQGEQESANRGGDDPDYIVDIIVRDAEHDDDHEERREKRRR